MYFKTLCILLSVFGFIQVMKPVNSINIQPRDKWDDAEKALRDFADEAQLSINNSMVELDKLNQEATDEGDVVRDNILEALRNLTGQYEDQLEQIRNSGDESNQGNIDACIDLYRQRMQVVTGNAAYFTASCISNKRGLVWFETTNSIDEIQTRTSDEIEKMRNDIEGCTIAVNSDECISRIIIEILFRHLDIVKVHEEIVRRTRDICVAYLGFDECKFRVTTAHEEIDVLMDFLRDCISSGQARNELYNWISDPLQK